MAGSYAAIYMHFVFSTKSHQPFLTEPHASRVFRYMSAMINKDLGQTITINGMADHIHVLTGIHRDISASEFMRRLKGNSSKWIKNELNPLFAWQSGYGVFSVSKSVIPKVQTYIKNQVRHHQEQCYKTEFQSLLTKHEVDYNPEFLWVSD